MIEAMDAAGCTIEQIVAAVRRIENGPCAARVERAGVLFSDDAFDRFLAAYPERPGGTAREPAMMAWRKAIAAGADQEALIDRAAAYARDVAGIEPRYIAAAPRWLAEGRWRAKTSLATPMAAGVWITAGSPEFQEWARFWRATKGTAPPTDAKGGWRFPTRTPPAMVAAE